MIPFHPASLWCLAGDCCLSEWEGAPTLTELCLSVWEGSTTKGFFFWWTHPAAAARAEFTATSFLSPTGRRKGSFPVWVFGISHHPRGARASRWICVGRRRRTFFLFFCTLYLFNVFFFTFFSSFALFLIWCCWVTFVLSSVWFVGWLKDETTRRW